jgi:VWFA-related protein
MHAFPWRALTLVSAACFFASAASAADDPRVSITPRTRPAAVHPDIRVDSNLVLIPVSVTDSRNHAVTGLSRDAFHIFEDKTEQALVQFACEDAPISVGIVFDASSSMLDKIAKSREALGQFLHFANPEDEFFLVEFSTRPRLTVPFTTDPGLIRTRLLHIGASGTTALLDAVSLAMDRLRTAHYPRRALLVLSDGGDNHSRYTETELRNRIRESDLWIYTMGIYGRRPPNIQVESDAGQKLMEMLAEESGGRHYAVDSLVDLPVVAARIALELRNQYVLGYQPADSRRDGKYHRVQVKVVAGRHLTVSWRPGYYDAGQ